MPDKKSTPSWMKPTAEYGPLVVFFLTYWKWDLLTATAWLMGATVIALGIYYKFTGRVPMMPLMTVVIVAIFGGLTLWLQDETFIKMKPTIVEGLFSAILLGGLAFKRPLLKPLMGHAWPMKDRGWHLLSLRFGIFFAAMAVLNEIVWRNYPTDVWVTFKVFGLMVSELTELERSQHLKRRQELFEAKKEVERNSGENLPTKDDSNISCGRPKEFAQDTADKTGQSNWLPWLEVEFGMSKSTAENFINVADQLGGKSATVADLTITQKALYMLAAPNTDDGVRDAALRRATTPHVGSLSQR